MFGWGPKDAPRQGAAEQHVKIGRYGHFNIAKVQKEPRPGARKGMERDRAKGPSVDRVSNVTPRSMALSQEVEMGKDFWIDCLC